MSEAKFKKGDKVRVKGGINPYYGWGGIKKEDVGVFVRMDGKRVVVNFPKHDGWLGKPDEMELVEKRKPTKKSAPAKWAPLDLREMWGIGPKTTRARILEILLKTEETLNAYGRENARLKARRAKGGK